MSQPTLRDEIKYNVANAMAEVDPGAYTERTEKFINDYTEQIEQAIVRRLIELRRAQDADAVQDAHHEGVCQGIELAIAAVGGETAGQENI